MLQHGLTFAFTQVKPQYKPKIKSENILKC